MSLLDRKAPHRAWVQARKMERTADGLRDYVPDGDPVEIRCKVEPVRDWSSAEEEYLNGVQLRDLRVVYCRKWHGDVNATVLWDDDIYEVIGQPQLFKASHRTRHQRITIQWIGKRKPDVWPSPIPEEAP